MKKRVGVFALIIALSLGSSLAFTKMFTLYKVNGNSMSPTFDNDSFIVVKNKKTLEKEDIVTFTPNDTWDKDLSEYVKRLKGVAGDEVEVIEHQLVINGEPQGTALCLTTDKVTIPEGHYFLVGDNRKLSNDSLTQMCNGNKDIFVPDNQIINYGTLEWVIK